MLAAEQACYTLIHSLTDVEPANEMQIKQELEKGDDRQKVETMKKIILHILNGEKLSGILMTVIRFVMPTLDHTLKKLLHIFWEIVPKYGPDGKLLHEMILVCDAYRRDLQHPNEYIRGATLRFLCKLKESELLEPLMPAIRDCLKYRHAYVRRNAVLAIFTIYKNYDFLIPDAPELMAQFLQNEQDASCKRNAFLMLLHVDQERALSYLSQYIDQVQSFGDILQLVVVQLIYKVCQTNASERARFIRCIYSLLNSASAAVRYEAAGTLVTLSNAPTAIRAAAQCYIELVVKESDNNVKLIVLDRLIALNQLPVHHRVLQELVMDVLRILSASDLEVRRKTLDLALELVTAKNVEEMVLVLKKETIKSANASGNDEDAHKYRRLLVRAVHQCSIRFIDVASGVIPMLCDFLTDPNETSGLEVLVFLREAIHKYENLRPDILVKLLDALPSIKSVRIYRATIWLLGEFSESVEEVQSTIGALRRLLGDLPLVETELRERERLLAKDREPTSREEAAANALLSSNAPTTRTLITSDGTYATQTALTVTSAAQTAAKMGGSVKDSAPLRKHLLDGDFFIGAAIATTLAKLALRYTALVSDAKKQNALVAECMFIIVSIFNLGRSPLPAKKLTEDDQDRLVVCIKVLADRGGPLLEILNRAYRESLAEMLIAQAEEERKAASSAQKQQNGATLDDSSSKTSVEVDQPVVFAQLMNKNDLATLGDAKLDSVQLALQGTGTGVISSASGINGKRNDELLSASKLNKVTQLTGFSDPVYAEAYISVNQYDVVLDVLVVNQSADTLQNLTLELSTLGDLKLVEKPNAITLAPHDFASIKASVKVASTENGIIFGNLVYDLRGAASDRNCVVLNDVHIDIMDYIMPATCSDAEFRRMWIEFEWENKIQVNTNITDLREYLEHLVSSTNMRCLTPARALCGECGFMAACLYARSIFGEDALANVSLEKPPLGPPNAPVTGHIRIRAKSQGMALSLGDKVNSSQKKGSASAEAAPAASATAQEEDIKKSTSADADADEDND